MPQSFIHSLTHPHVQKITYSVAILGQTLLGNEVTLENIRHKVLVPWTLQSRSN